MDLGTFSVSLGVKNLSKSLEFYQKLGFEKFAGDESNNYVILRNGLKTIGLFQGMFEGNILTFNPGWNDNCEKLDDFDDVRSIQKKLKDGGVEFSKEVEEGTSGPGSFVIQDPDGNTIMLDQHV